MAQSLINKKSNFMNRLMSASQQLLAMREALIGLASEWTAEGYVTGIVQADIDAAAAGLQHLTPTILAGIITEQANLETFLASAGRLTNWYAVRGS